MMGPALLLTSLLLSSNTLPTFSKPLGSGPQSPVHQDVGTNRRLRRDLSMPLPYEAEMMGYPPNKSYLPEVSDALLARLAGMQKDERLAQALERMGTAGRTEQGLDRLALSGRDQDERLGLALQQAMEDGRQGDKDAIYLANLLHLWNEMSQAKGYPNQLPGSARATKMENEFQGLYPDYDETGLMSNMVMTPSSRNQLNAQLAQELLNRYRQDEASPSRTDLEEPNEEDGQMDEEVLRYLVGRILAGIIGKSQHLPRRDLGPLEFQGPAKRLRRSLDEEHLPQTNLLRVKRLGDEDEEPSAVLGDATYRLQRAKRPEEHMDEPTKALRIKRYASYSDPEFSEQFLKYLPE
ncbi:proSAAS [Microcaecilia unicolor]|uniref:ProSAAS-like n=1 Tax=Microcaecilia unicolor TaxID=1415580 RepID=A0A6P7XDK3_9AMPH|nr:proSAAS-like [Microcaecilia unicolor]